MCCGFVRMFEHSQKPLKPLSYNVAGCCGWRVLLTHSLHLDPFLFHFIIIIVINWCYNWLSTTSTVFAAKLAIKQKIRIYRWVDDDDVKIKWYIERDIIRMWDVSVYLYRYATILPSLPFNQNKIDENWIIMCCLLGRSVVVSYIQGFSFFFLFMLITLKTSRNSFMSHLSVKSKSNVFLTQIIDISHRVFIRYVCFCRTFCRINVPLEH